MRTVYAIVIWICLIVLCAESDNLVAFLLSKVIAAVVMVVVGKLFIKTMTEEELNEEV